jgi:hypothetical protein
MGNRPKKTGDEQPDDLSYEDFDDTAWGDDDELDVIDLDALDDEIADEITTEITAKDETAPDQPEPVAEEKPELTDQAAPSPAAESAAEDEPAPAATVPAEITPVEVAPVPEPEAEPEAEAEQEPEPAAEPAPPDAAPEFVIPPDVYCALLPLPPELAAQALELRETGEIRDMPPPGILLTAPFRTTDRAAVEAALEKWTRAHLPFQFEVTGVLAKVVGTQQYIAAWALEPAEELVEAQHALRLALAELILPLPGATLTFDASVLIGEHITPQRFPHVIGQMQRHFEPFVWRANELQFVRQGDPPDQWDMVRAFD